MTKSQDSSSDEEENIEVQEVSFEDRLPGSLHFESDPIEENVLVEGDDYDVIQVFEVDPNLDLEVSSDDEDQGDFAVPEKNSESDADYLIPQEKLTNHVGHCETNLPVDVLNCNLDTPVVSNVDEYFIKHDKDKDILAVKEEPVVSDVDEYFIKVEIPKEINVDDFFVKENPPEDTQFDVKPVTIDGFFAPNIVKAPEQPSEPKSEEVPINESDLEVLPNIEELKRFLLEDMTYSKLRNAQRSCSLPQSPMHNLCLDIDDSKTCLSFEDLNLDLSDLTFDNDKEKSGKSDDAPRALTDEDVNSFLITTKSEPKERPRSVEPLNDDFSHQDMEIDRPVESTVTSGRPIKLENTPSLMRTSTPVQKPSVLDFAIEKTAIKKEKIDVKVEVDDFVDVESCNDTVIPVLEANNLNSLLEQFEATEKLNTKSKRPVIKVEEQKVKSACLTNGMRLQDAGVQLNKTKMRQILMPSTINAAVRRSPSPVHSDHDYCSSKKRFSLPNIKGGQSLLKPEVLSSNSRILNSRHRTCKNKRIVYALSSDDEGDKNKAKIKKLSVKQTVKLIPQATRKKLSPVHSAPNDYKDKDKSNSSVIVKDACEASDTPISQSSNCSIKLTIKNKSEVILNCDDKDSQKDKNIEKAKPSVSDKETKLVKVDTQNNYKSYKNAKHIKELVSNKVKGVSSIENSTNANAKEGPRPKEENFYTALFSNKQDVQIPQPLQVKTEKRSFEEEISIATKLPNKEDQPQKKKKLNLQEYKMRRCVSSNSSSAAVSPEAIFPDMQSPFGIEKTAKCTPSQTQPNGPTNERRSNEAPKKIFDPIREASRKILMNTKKLKAEAMRKRDEDFVMSKIPKVENLELQPLISDAEMMKIVGMAPAEALPKPIVNEKPQIPAEYEEIVMVSIGVNTNETILKEMEKSQRVKASQSPTDLKSGINFKIKKSDLVLKQNVFDVVKRDRRSPIDEKKHSEKKIDKERFKDITATLKSVGKQVDTKISSNSLFASIQDVVRKKAPDEVTEKTVGIDKRSKSNSPKRKAVTPIKTTIIRDYDVSADHGEDKIILHLQKDRNKPKLSVVDVQTDSIPEFAELSPTTIQVPVERTPNRKRNDSDMSMSSENSSKKTKSEQKKKIDRRSGNRSLSVEKRSKSKDRYDKYRRSRSRSRSRRRRRSHSRSRSRSRSPSRGRFRRYRRSDSPYRRKRRSRSSYRRRSPSIRREYRSKCSRSRNVTGSKSPLKKKSPHKVLERKFEKSMTPPPRKPTISESSYSSTSSSSSSSSSSSGKSRKSNRSSARGSSSPYKRDDFRKMQSPSNSEDRENNTPVEERRIVFVGRLEKDITKAVLRSQFSKFGSVVEVRLHSKEDGSRYGFVTYQRARDAWSAVEASGTFPQYDVGFGGRRAFCRQSYADLDGLEAKYTESAFHGAGTLPPRNDNDMSFEQMLLEMKKKLNQRKGDKTDDLPKLGENKTKNYERSKRDEDMPKRDEDRPKRGDEKFKRDNERWKRDDNRTKRDEERPKRDEARPKHDV